MLIGRESECARLDELLDHARTGRSGALVIRGDAGIGKTALLDYAVGRADGMTVVRALGVESEAELDFSGLLEVCRPLLDRLDELPARQADALRSALGLGVAEEHDRFAIGAATLGLLAAAADEAPLLIVVDDAQWLDGSSADALLFATRRLEADSVLTLYAARDGEERSFEAPGMESISLAGLRRSAATMLLRSGTLGLRPAVTDRLIDATRGNPLALIELPRMLSDDQLSGIEPLEEPLPAGVSIERAFAGRAQALPEQSRRALLVAAVSTSSELAIVARALGALGLDRSSLEAAEDAGLVRLVGARLEFRHPLVRSALYHSAPPSERRAAHRALADACGDTGPEECTWHLAAAALGPDEAVAAALELAAGDARRRSGFAAAAAALERAARLTPNRDEALRRFAAAADAAWHAGRADLAAKLADEALAGAGNGPLRAEALRLRGSIGYFRGEGQTAADAFLEAAALLEESSPDEAVSVAADAVNALVRARQFERALQTAERGRSLAPTDGGATDLEATVALGFALCFAARYRDAEPHLQRAVELSKAEAATPSVLQATRLSAALAWLGRFGDAEAYLADAVARARGAGAVGSLPHLLVTASWQGLHAGRWNEALADGGEAVALAEELGQPVVAVQALGALTWLHALRGDEAGCRAYGDETRSRAHERGYRLYGLLVSAALGVLDLGAGRVDEAIEGLEEVARYADERGLYIPGIAPQFELAEAYARAGAVAEAEAVLASFERSDLVAAPLLAALAERCRGLLAGPDDFDAHFLASLALHERIDSPFAVARTMLCFGERLRRAGRRVEAREQLRTAVDLFEPRGAVAWAERARSELRASGETLRRRDAFEADQLTPQELQIALQVAEGKTNKEVGAALFLSHKTVEFHLSRIFRKLDLHSRAELIRRVAAGEPVAA